MLAQILVGGQDRRGICRAPFKRLRPTGGPKGPLFFSFPRVLVPNTDEVMILSQSTRLHSASLVLTSILVNDLALPPPHQSPVTSHQSPLPTLVAEALGISGVAIRYPELFGPPRPCRLQRKILYPRSAVSPTSPSHRLTVSGTTTTGSLADERAVITDEHAAVPTSPAGDFDHLTCNLSGKIRRHGPVTMVARW